MTVIGYSWQRNGLTIEPSGESSFTIPNAQPSDAGIYTVLVTNTANPSPGVLSSGAVVTVSTSLPPAIAAQPQSQIVPAGHNVMFTSTVKGSGPFRYQWQLNGTDVVGATNLWLVLRGVQQIQAGNYPLVVSDSFGCVKSTEAVLSVTPSAPLGFVWASSAGGPDYDRANGSTVDAAGNCYVTGRFNGSAAFGFHSLTEAGDSDIFVAKVDAAGIWQWAQRDGTSGGDEGSGVAVDVMGNLYVVGSVGAATNRWSDLSLAKYDCAGARQWGRTAGNSTNNHSVGSDVALDAAGNAYVCGTVGGIYIAKFDAAGTRVWSLQPPGYGFAYGIGVNDSGFGVAVGYLAETMSFGSITLTNHPGLDAYVVAFSSGGVFASGAQMWTDRDVYATRAAVDMAGNAYVMGRFNSPVHFGSTFVTNAGASDGYVAKYDRLGGLQWVQALAGRGDDDIRAVALDPSGNPHIAGEFTGVARLGDVTLTTDAGRGCFVAKLDSEGVPQWVQQFGYAQISDLGIDGATNVFLSGSYIGRATFGKFTVASTGSYDAFVAKLVNNPPPIYLSTATTSGGGVIAESPPGTSYLSNTVVTFTATAAPGWTFLQWLGDASGSNSINMLRISRDICVQAMFGTTMGTFIAGNGSIVVDPVAALYPFGTIVRLTAVPQAGHQFAAWGNAVSSTNNPLLVPITNASPTVSCLFAPLSAGQQALTVIANGRGQVTTNPRGTRFTTGQSVTLTAWPDPDQRFLGWSGDASGTQTNLLVVMNQSRTITASFTRRPRLALAQGFASVREEGFQFTLTGDFGAGYAIDTSTDLVHWTPWLTATNQFGTVQFLDPEATNRVHQFYRALLQP
jgi:hypothetical protein